MQNKDLYHVDVDVQVEYLEEHSQPQHHRYLFAYTIVISNQGQTPAKLMTRKWAIQDANGKLQEVFGDGVVGEQPYLKPGERYRYTSSAMIETSVGSMSGSYQMVADDGYAFDALIPAFSLSIPRVLH